MSSSHSLGRSKAQNVVDEEETDAIGIVTGGPLAFIQQRSFDNNNNSNKNYRLIVTGETSAVSASTTTASESSACNKATSEPIQGTNVMKE